MNNEINFEKNYKFLLKVCKLVFNERPNFYNKRKYGRSIKWYTYNTSNKKLKNLSKLSDKFLDYCVKAIILNKVYEIEKDEKIFNSIVMLLNYTTVTFCKTMYFHKYLHYTDFKEERYGIKIYFKNDKLK